MPTRMLKLAALASLAAQPIGAEQAPDFAPYPMADGAAEVALARTAAPRHVSDSATVLVLTRNGFVEAARGTNGFTCLVLRSFAGNIGDPDFWNPRVRAPHCFNPPAVRDRKSTRLNSSHANISYAVFCLKKKTSSTTVK